LKRRVARHASDVMPTEVGIHVFVMPSQVGIHVFVMPTEVGIHVFTANSPAQRPPKSPNPRGIASQYG
jgi:hypothetical protein